MYLTMIYDNYHLIFDLPPTNSSTVFPEDNMSYHIDICCDDGLFLGTPSSQNVLEHPPNVPQKIKRRSVLSYEVTHV